MRIFWLALVFTAVWTVVGCGDDEGGNGGTDADSDGDADTDADADADADADGDGDTDSTSDDDTDSEFENVGLCKVHGISTATQGSLEGFQEYYLLADKGLGDELCRVRFDLGTAGELPQKECADCRWTAPVEMTGPQVITDVDGACASSELGLDEQTLEEMDGKRFSWGWVYEYAGHSDVLMQYDPSAEAWDAVGTADWDEETGELWYDRSDGFCGY